MANGNIGILVTRNKGQFKVSEHKCPWSPLAPDGIEYLDCLRPTWWEIWKIKIVFILLHGIAKNPIKYETHPRRSPTRN